MIPVICATLLALLAFLSYRQSGMYQNAERLWRTTIARSPKSGMAHNNLGLLLYQRGGINEAMYYLERATVLSPKNAEAHNNFGNALRVQGRLEGAIAEFRKASELRPDFVIYDANLGSALAESGRTREAVERYQAATVKAPADPFIASNLAWLLATSDDSSVRNGTLAVELAERALSHAPDDPRILASLSAAYAEAGRFDDAVRAGDKGRQLALAQGNRRLADLNAQVVERSRAGHPFHGN